MKKLIYCTVVLLIFTITTMAQTAPKKVPKLIGRTHEHFTLFWKDFKKAILANDSVAVSRLINYPFEDKNTIYRGDETLVCVNEGDFFMNYSALFPPHVKEAIKNDKYRGFDENYSKENGGDKIIQGQYILQPSTSQAPQYYDYIFTKVRGVFKMVRNAYYQN
jgi:hypothetical protein